MRKGLVAGVVMVVILALVLGGAVGCKKKGASKGPGEGDGMTPTPVPTSDSGRYADEIDDATRVPAVDTEPMDELKTINFDYDQYSLTSQARDILAENAIFLKRNLSVRAQIEGHCDDRGTVEYNLALGQKRADATKDYLVLMGIDPSRLTTISYGEERPLDASSSDYAWAKNRRAEFVILSR